MGDFFLSFQRGIIKGAPGGDFSILFIFMKDHQFSDIPADMPEQPTDISPSSVPEHTIHQTHHHPSAHPSGRKHSGYSHAPWFAVWVILFFVVTFFSGGVGGALVAGYVLSPEDTPASVKKLGTVSVIEDSGTVNVAENITPSVVSIVISKVSGSVVQQGPFSFLQPNSGEKKDVGGGTGFFVKKDGTILTNKHVVSEKDATYSVILSDGTRHEAQVLSIDPVNDLALVKIQVPADFTVQPVKLGDSDDLQVGQTVLAVGNSLAEYQNSVTKGVVSGIGREIVAGDIDSQETLNDVIQTDAAINPGNSGGPLVNLGGQVVGINTAIDSQGNGIGFAIPINQAKLAIESFEKFGKIVRPMLGIRYRMMSEELAKSENLPVTEGALIDSEGQSPAVVPGSPAEKAGLQEGDIIVSVGGAKVTTQHTLSALVQSYQVGDEITVVFLRDGKQQSVKVVLAEYSS